MPLPDVADDVVFTVARLESRKVTQRLGPPLAKHVDQADTAAGQHTQHRRALTKADAIVAGARADGEEFCAEFAKTLLGKVRQDRQALLFAKYYQKAPSELASADGAELLAWLDTTGKALEKETDKELKALAKPAKDAHTAWDAAEKARKVVDNGQHDATVRKPLRKAVNGSRKKTHAELTKLAVDGGKSKRPHLSGSCEVRRCARPASARHGLDAPHRPADPPPAPEDLADANACPALPARPHRARPRAGPAAGRSHRRHRSRPAAVGRRSARSAARSGGHGCDRAHRSAGRSLGRARVARERHRKPAPPLVGRHPGRRPSGTCFGLATASVWQRSLERNADRSVGQANGHGLPVTIPQAPMPKDGWPMVLFAHGTHGSHRSHVGTMAPVMSNLQVTGGPLVRAATIGIDGAMHGSRLAGDQARRVPPGAQSHAGLFRAPLSPWGYVAIADRYTLDVKPGMVRDPERAELWLRRGLAAVNPVDRDYYVLNERIGLGRRRPVRSRCCGRFEPRGRN